MMIPKRMLLACDPLDRGEPFPPAISSMARLFGAEVVLLNVVPRSPAAVWTGWGVESREIQRSLVRVREEELGTLARKLRGVVTTVEVRVGDPATEIVRAATEHGCDLVALLDDLRLRSSGRSFGTTTMKLMRKCPYPVWAVRHDSRRPKHVMAAVDVGPDVDRDFNAHILKLALQFVPPSAEPLTVLHAWSLWGEDFMAMHGRMDRDELAAVVEETRRAHERSLNDLLVRETIGDGEVRPLLVKGDPDHVVPTLVRDQRVDLLVMGTVAREGLPGLFMGNTAEKILHQVTCSVLTVKPGSFVSPMLASD